jgi:hypothetical protein
MLQTPKANPYCSFLCCCLGKTYPKDVAVVCNRLQKLSVLTRNHVVLNSEAEYSMKTKIIRYTSSAAFLVALFLSVASTQAIAKPTSKPSTVSVPEGGAVPMLVTTAGVLGAAVVLARRVAGRRFVR